METEEIYELTIILFVLFIALIICIRAGYTPCSNYQLMINCSYTQKVLGSLANDKNKNGFMYLMDWVSDISPLLIEKIKIWGIKPQI